MRTIGCLALVVVLLGVLPPQAQADDEPVTRLKKMSLEELVAIEVVSVSKKVESREGATAAVAVITGEDLQETGTRTLVDALRLAPGVQVGRIQSDQWAVGIRGFPGRLSRSVLALIDGRSVYTPLFAGVYWETQDTFLPDVDRIEVIRGPGGTLWGANAVNGVINVITKHSKDTQGVLARAGGGTEERGFIAARQGGQIAPGAFYRIYAKLFDRDAGFRGDGVEFDDWRGGQAGFRTDAALGGGDLTVQGDLYGIEAGQRSQVGLDAPRIVEEDADLQGGNVLVRFARATPLDGVLNVLGYYDRTRRDDVTLLEDRHTANLEFDHHFPLFAGNEIAWGGVYRFTTDATRGSEGIRFTPSSRELHLVSGFIQDQIWLVPETVRLTLGSKFEDNTLSGFEVQPNARLLWTPAEAHTVWAAVSRAVRTPSRIEEDLSLVAAPAEGSPLFPVVAGNREFESEVVRAHEIGYRWRVAPWAFADVAGFYNVYDNLLSIEPGIPFEEDGRQFLPFAFENGVRAESWGFEVAVDLEPHERWQIHTSYSFLELEVHEKPGSAALNARAPEGQSPQNQALVRSSVHLAEALDAHVLVRWIDDLPADGIGSYWSADVRLAWQPASGIEVAVVGHDLVDAHHTEFSGGQTGVGGSEVQRGGFVELEWRF